MRNKARFLKLNRTKLDGQASGDWRFPNPHSLARRACIKRGFLKTRSFGLISNLLLAAVASIIAVVVLGYMAVSIRPDAKIDVSAAKTVRVYCAAGVAGPLEQLVQAFNKQSSYQIQIARIGGSGELAGQIKTEFDTAVLNSAHLLVTNDDHLLKQPSMVGICDQQFVLAIQRPVIAVSAESRLELRGIETMLLDKDIKYGIASKRAAIGSLARKIAQHHDVLAELERRKSVDAENVMVLAQALVTGSLDAAVIWNTTVSQINNQSNSTILKIAGPADSANPTTSNVTACIVASHNNREAVGAKSFIEFLIDRENREQVFESFGFESAQELAQEPSLDSGQ